MSSFFAKMGLLVVAAAVLEAYETAGVLPEVNTLPWWGWFGMAMFLTFGNTDDD